MCSLGPVPGCLKVQDQFILIGETIESGVEKGKTEIIEALKTGHVTVLVKEGQYGVKDISIFHVSSIQVNEELGIIKIIQLLQENIFQCMRG